jgi:transposase
MASLAREHDLNANQLFYWRKLYRAGQLCEDPSTERQRSVQLLPISVADDEPLAGGQEQFKTSAPRLTMNIEIPGRALVSLEGAIDAMFIRTVLEGLRG